QLATRSEDRQLDRRADRAEDVADRAAKKQEGDDRNDRDEGEDQRVGSATRRVLVTLDEVDESSHERHCFPVPPFFSDPRRTGSGREPYAEPCERGNRGAWLAGPETPAAPPPLRREGARAVGAP